MKELFALVKRNTKIFFKDKGMFFTSLVTPLILLLLYVTFLAEVYRDSLLMSLPEGVLMSDKLLNGTVGGQLFSSLLAVSCVTVAFCSNMLMVTDKSSGIIADLTVTPVKRSTMAAAYFIATALTTLIVAFVAIAACLVYLAVVGWYLTISDLPLIVLDVILLVLFGTGLSSIINFFLSSQGQISAVGTIVSAGYGFICGAYMPISQFGAGIQRIISFLPGTYGTALLRRHTLRGAFAAMKEEGIPDEVVDQFSATMDCSVDFMGTTLSPFSMYCILGGSVLLLSAIYVYMNVMRSKKVKRIKKRT